jgi:hypothetical protein
MQQWHKSMHNFVTAASYLDYLLVSVRMGLYADELQDYTNSGTYNFNTTYNNVTADNATVASLWTSSYSQIYNANSVIQGVEN